MVDLPVMISMTAPLHVRVSDIVGIRRVRDPRQGVNSISRRGAAPVGLMTVVLSRREPGVKRQLSMTQFGCPGGRILAIREFENSVFVLTASAPIPSAAFGALLAKDFEEIEVLPDELGERLVDTGLERRPVEVGVEVVLRSPSHRLGGDGDPSRSICSVWRVR